MTTVKDFFEMIKLMTDVNIDVDIYPNAQNQKEFKTLAYNYDGERRFFPEVLDEYGARKIAYIEFCFEDDYNTACYNLTLTPD